MANFSEFNFKDFLRLAIAHLTPKSKENGLIVLQAVVEINGKEYFMRANAPNNYRKIYWRLDQDQIQKLLKQDEGKYPFWGENITELWVKSADHDSCWDGGLNLSRLIDDKFSTVNLKRINLLQAKMEDYKPNVLSWDLPVITSINFDGLDYWESVVALIKAFYQTTDSFEFSMYQRKDHKKVKTCRLFSVETMELGNSGKTVEFSAKELKKYLKNPDDYEMDNYANHRRDGTHFY